MHRCPFPGAGAADGDLAATGTDWAAALDAQPVIGPPAASRSTRLESRNTVSSVSIVSGPIIQ